jgi:hypothetical protein
VKKYVLVVFSLVLSGCGGNSVQPATEASSTMPVAPPPGHSIGGGSLIYASDYGTNALDFYSYRTGKPEGQITSGVSGPQGLCSDANGNVFLTNTNDTNVLEFKHGGTSSIKTLSTSGEYPSACAVSSKRTLAVAAICNSESCGEGALMLFANEMGSPTTVSCPNIYRYYSDAYDNKDNLFVTGEDASFNFAFCEVPRGSSSGIAITFGTSPAFPGGVAWDGRYIALLDQTNDTIGRYAISGSKATLKGTVTLSGTEGDLANFVMANKKTLLAASSTGYAFWHYPKGGNPYKTQAETLVEPIGLAISPLPKL